MPETAQQAGKSETRTHVPASLSNACSTAPTHHAPPSEGREGSSSHVNQAKESSLEELKSQMSGSISQPADPVQPPKASPASAPTGVSGGVRDKQAEDALPSSGISVPAEDSRRRWVELGSCATLQGGYRHPRLHLDTSASFCAQAVLWTSTVLMTQPSCR